MNKNRSKKRSKNKQFSSKRKKRQLSFKAFYQKELITIAALLSLCVECFFAALKDSLAPCPVMDTLRCEEIADFAIVEAIAASVLFISVMVVFKGILKHRLTY